MFCVLERFTVLRRQSLQASAVEFLEEVVSMKRRELFFFFFFFEEEGTRQLDRSDFVLQFVVWMECTDGEDGGVSVLIELVMLW